MSIKMMQFVSLNASMPDKRAVPERSDDFAEIYGRFSHERAGQQASRCEQCGVPFCQVHCPLQNNIPDWLKLAAEGRLEEAYELSSATNNMPEICGRICPQDRLCEGNCVIEQSGHGAVTIGVGREVHHGHRLRRRLGQADPARSANSRSRWGSSAPAQPASPARRNCVAKAARCTSTIATTESAAC